jgi:hypothetical protein
MSSGIKKRAVGRGGPVLRTAPRRARDLAKRGEAQGGRGRCAEGHTIRHVCQKRFVMAYSELFLINLKLVLFKGVLL